MTGGDHPRPVGAAAIGVRRPWGPVVDSADLRTGCCSVPARPGPCRDHTSGRRRCRARREGHSPSVRRCPVRSPFRVLSSVPRKRTVSVHADALVPTSPARAAPGVGSVVLRERRRDRRRGRCRVRRSQRIRGGWVRVQVREPRVLFREILPGDARRQRLTSARSRDNLRPPGDRSDEHRLFMGPRCPAPRHPQPATPLAPGSRGQVPRPLEGRGRRLLRVRRPRSHGGSRSSRPPPTSRSPSCCPTRGPARRSRSPRNGERRGSRR